MNKFLKALIIRIQTLRTFFLMSYISVQIFMNDLWLIVHSRRNTSVIWITFIPLQCKVVVALHQMYIAPLKTFSTMNTFDNSRLITDQWSVSIISVTPPPLIWSPGTLPALGLFPCTWVSEGCYQSPSKLISWLNHRPRSNFYAAPANFTPNQLFRK